jgi:hypothetical protein
MSTTWPLGREKDEIIMRIPQMSAANKDKNAPKDDDGITPEIKPRLIDGEQTGITYQNVSQTRLRALIAKSILYASDEIAFKPKNLFSEKYFQGFILRSFYRIDNFSVLDLKSWRLGTPEKLT